MSDNMLLAQSLLGREVELIEPVFSAKDRLKAGTRGVVKCLTTYADGKTAVLIEAPNGIRIDEISTDKVREPQPRRTMAELAQRRSAWWVE